MIQSCSPPRIRHVLFVFQERRSDVSFFIIIIRYHASFFKIAIDHLEAYILELSSGSKFGVASFPILKNKRDYMYGGTIERD